jgi:hypothetical protein
LETLAVFVDVLLKFFGCFWKFRFKFELLLFTRINKFFWLLFAIFDFSFKVDAGFVGFFDAGLFTT